MANVMKVDKKEADEQYIELLKSVLQEKKVWERNDLMEVFRKAIKNK